MFRVTYLVKKRGSSFLKNLPLCGEQDLPLRSATSCRFPLRRLHSLSLPSMATNLENCSALLATFKTARFGSSPVSDFLISLVKIKKVVHFRTTFALRRTGLAATVANLLFAPSTAPSLAFGSSPVSCFSSIFR